MLDFPVDFTNKASLPAGVGGTGYPFTISANDLMRDFHYAGLTANEGWIEPSNDSLFAERKLKMPAVPQSGGDSVFVLSVKGGQFTWLEYKEKQVSICDNNYEKTGVILFRET